MPLVGIYIHPWHTYSQDILRGIARFNARHQGFETYLPWPGEKVASLPAERLDGLILRIGGPHDVPPDFGKNLPRVVIANTDDTSAKVDISWDNYAIGRQAGEHLLEQGHRQIFAIGEFQRWPYQRHRVEGMANTLAGRATHIQRIDLDSLKAGELKKRLLAIPRPAGIFATTDAIGGQVLQDARTAQIHVPEDLAVVAAGDYDVYCEMTSPPLSSVSLPGAEVGYVAASRMHALLSTGTRPAPVSIAPRFVITRKSSDMLAVDDQFVARALKAIRSGAPNGITVDQVRRLVPLSQRAIELRFKKTMSRTIEQEILRVRLAAAKRLLIDTDLPMASVADRAGFSTGQRLSAVFARELKQSPSAFRANSRHPGRAD